MILSQHVGLFGAGATAVVDATAGLYAPLGDQTGAGVDTLVICELAGADAVRRCGAGEGVWRGGFRCARIRATSLARVPEQSKRKRLHALRNPGRLRPPFFSVSDGRSSTFSSLSSTVRGGLVLDFEHRLPGVYLLHRVDCRDITSLPLQ